jgi:hypothetical protein
MEEVEILKELVRSKEEFLLRNGREEEILNADDYFPSNYVRLQNVAPKPKTKSTQKKRRRKNEDDEDDDEDFEDEVFSTRRKVKVKKEVVEKEAHPNDGNPHAFHGAFFRLISAFNDLRKDNFFFLFSI